MTGCSCGKLYHDRVEKCPMLFIGVQPTLEEALAFQYGPTSRRTTKGTICDGLVNGEKCAR